MQKFEVVDLSKVSLNDGVFKYSHKGINLEANVSLESMNFDIDGVYVKIDLTLVVNNMVGDKQNG